MRVVACARPADEPRDATVDLHALCGHVAPGAEVLERGYRFMPMPGADVPPFLIRRFQAGARPAAVTLLAGVDPETGDDVAGDLPDALALARLLAVGRGGVWLLRLSLGARTIGLDELEALARRDPLAAAAFAAELVALEPLTHDDCPICRSAA